METTTQKEKKLFDITGKKNAKISFSLLFVIIITTTNNNIY